MNISNEEQQMNSDKEEGRLVPAHPFLRRTYHDRLTAPHVGIVDLRNREARAQELIGEALSLPKLTGIVVPDDSLYFPWAETTHHIDKKDTKNGTTPSFSIHKSSHRTGFPDEPRTVHNMDEDPSLSVLPASDWWEKHDTSSGVVGATSREKQRKLHRRASEDGSSMSLIPLQICWNKTNKQDYRGSAAAGDSLTNQHLHAQVPPDTNRDPANPSMQLQEGSDKKAVHSSAASSIPTMSTCMVDCGPAGLEKLNDPNSEEINEESTQPLQRSPQKRRRRYQRRNSFVIRKNNPFQRGEDNQTPRSDEANLFSLLQDDDFLTSHGILLRDGDDVRDYNPWRHRGQHQEYQEQGQQDPSESQNPDSVRRPDKSKAAKCDGTPALAQVSLAAAAEEGAGISTNHPIIRDSDDMDVSRDDATRTSLQKSLQEPASMHSAAARLQTNDDTEEEPTAPSTDWANYSWSDSDDTKWYSLMSTLSFKHEGGPHEDSSPPHSSPDATSQVPQEGEASMIQHQDFQDRMKANFQVPVEDGAIIERQPKGTQAARQI